MVVSHANELNDCIICVLWNLWVITILDTACKGSPVSLSCCMLSLAKIGSCSLWVSILLILCDCSALHSSRCANFVLMFFFCTSDSYFLSVVICIAAMQCLTATSVIRCRFLGIQQEVRPKIWHGFLLRCKAMSVACELPVLYSSLSMSLLHEHVIGWTCLLSNMIT